jgi:hypothetical protein
VARVEMIKYIIQLRHRLVLPTSFRLPQFSIIIGPIKKRFLQAIRETIIITFNFYLEAVSIAEYDPQLTPTTKML